MQSALLASCRATKVNKCCVEATSAICRQHDVVRLHVAMDDIACMAMGQSRKDLGDNSSHHTFIEWGLVVLQDLTSIAARDILQYCNELVG